MNATGIWTGVIIVDGYSTRFGEEDKAVASLLEVPPIYRVTDRIAGVADSLVANCRSKQTAALRAALDGYDHPIAIAGDSECGKGLMAGIMTGLRAVETEYALVVACNMPFLEPMLIDRLFKRAAGHDTAVSRVGDGRFQPTHVVYRTLSMADVCEVTLVEGNHKVIDPLFTFGYAALEESETHGYVSLDAPENISTPDKFAHAAEQLR